jgi:DNA-binding beta-propeller fold protein YncE
MKQIFMVLTLSLIVISCERIHDNPGDVEPEESFISGDGVFIINEGNFTWGNGSISYYSYDSSKVHNDIFYKVNTRPLGDVPNSMVIYGEYAYIIVNNSGKVEVVKKNSLASVATITGLISPRNLVVIDNNKAYVTSLYSDSLTILDLKTNTIKGYINIRRTSEAIVIMSHEAFISNWYGGDEVIVVNTDLDKIIDSIKVGREPESMVVDKNYILWVLCNGGWAREYFAELVGISTQTHEIMKRHVFPSILNSPLALNINGIGDTLFFLENGIKRMSIDAKKIPETSFIEQKGHYFYKLGVNPVNGDIFVTDAVDYQQDGFVTIYNNNGDSLRSYQVGVIPGSLCFKVQLTPGNE